jgi:Tol biopolymer transport system component
MAGDIEPAGPATAGTLTILGALPDINGTTIALELGGPGSSDLLDIVGNAFFTTGTVDATTLLAGYTPTAGDSMVILLADALDGAVSQPTILLPDSAGGFEWVLNPVDGTSRDSVWVKYQAVQAAPPGTETVWLGGASTSWTEPANWSGSNVPDDTMSVWVPAGRPNDPTINGSVTAQDLIVETGATVTIPIEGALTVFGDIDAGYSSISGAGTVQLFAPTGNINGVFPNLEITGVYTATDSVRTTGGLVVVGAGSDLILGGNRVEVGGDFLTLSDARFTMQNAADTLLVAGNVAFDGTSTNTRLTDGVFAFGGDFAQQSTTNVSSFSATGNHQTWLVGAGQQTVGFVNPSSGLSSFANLQIANAGGVSFGTSVEATGTLAVTQPVLVTGADSIRAGAGVLVGVGAAITAPVLDVTGPMRAPIAGFSIDTVLYSGGTSTLPDSLPYNVLKVGSGTGFPANVVLSGTTVTTGDVLIDGPNGTRLIMNGQQLTVGGDLRVGYPTSGRGHIEMVDGTEGILVLGNATFSGASTALQANARWTDGFLEVRGNFEQIAAAGQPHTFQPDAAHQTIFSGGSAQTITFASPDTSRFGGLLIGNADADVSLTTNAKAIGPVTIATGANLNVGSSTFLASDGGTFNHNDGAQVSSGTAGTLDISNTVIGGGSARGDFQPGGAGTAGRLTIDGTLPFDALGTVAIELGGRTTPGSDWDLLTHNGDPNVLNGQLVVTLINGFTMLAGDKIPVATFNPAAGDPTPLSKFSGGVNLPTQAGLTIDTLWSNNATGSDTLYVVASPALAFTTIRDDHNEVYTINVDVGLTNLTNNGASDADPDWTSDGTRIVFFTDRDNPGVSDEIYVMNADGTNPTNLTDNVAGDAWPEWSPDDSQIAFASNRGDVWDIYTMDANGANVTQVTDLPDSEEKQPTWSPDGTRIAYYTNRHGLWQLYTINKDGTGEARLMTSAGNDYFPAWSPDGTKIAFTTDRDGNSEIYVVNADGTNPVRLTNDSAFDLQPTWSPDGAQIAFTSDRANPGVQNDIWVMNADGSNPVRVTTSQGQLPSWLPAVP